MKAYYINLDSRTDRRKNIEQRLAQEGIEGIRFSALSPVKEKPDFEVAKHPLRQPFNKGEIGCAMSHRALWKGLLESNEPYRLILEDDALLVENFKSRVEQEIDKVPSNWDLIFLGRHYYQYTPSFNSPTAGMMPTETKGIFKSTNNWLTHAYIIKPKAAKFFLEASAIMNDSIDGIMAREDHNLEVYTIFPFLAVQDGTKSNLR